MPEKRRFSFGSFFAGWIVALLFLGLIVRAVASTEFMTAWESLTAGIAYHVGALLIGLVAAFE